MINWFKIIVLRQHYPTILVAHLSFNGQKLWLTKSWSPLENRSRQSAVSGVHWVAAVIHCHTWQRRPQILWYFEWRAPIPHWIDEFQRIGSSNIENIQRFLLSEKVYKSSERALALNTSSGNCGKWKLNWNVLFKLTGRCQIMTFWLKTNWFCPVGKKS